MRHIQKNITHEARQALLTFIRLEKGKTHYDNFKHSDGKGDVQQSLLIEQGFLCAYCMRRIVMPPKIEHWVTREKSNADKKPKQTVDYDNILAVCNGIQGLKNDHDPKWKLLDEFARLVRELQPDIVSMENVPELQRHPIFDRFLATLADEDFHFTEDREKQVVYCPDYGIPQHRRRLVLVASRLGPIELIAPTHPPSRHRKVRDALSRLKPLAAGDVSPDDPLHRTSELSPLNLRRIRHSQPGGTWRDWPRDLVAKCHRKKTGKTYPGVYGRMEWGEPSPTITTQFFGFGNGRFGHPEQDRAISLREGAILQSFPTDYQFVKPGGDYCFKTIGRLIGNAVPVRLGEVVGKTIRQHLEEHHA